MQGMGLYISLLVALLLSLCAVVRATQKDRRNEYEYRVVNARATLHTERERERARYQP